MKKDRIRFNLLSLLIISIFFICLFNLSSFATCDLPGDFCGLMGDPTPDGKVDFNDLMVFATAYGSETGDPNWNALCDLCGYLGDPSPDDKVNFDDLMVFATNYGQSCPTVVRRALLVGVGDYLNFPDEYGNYDLPAPPFDVDMMRDTLSHSGDGFALINELKNLQATKSAILNGIASTFSEADADDISYFYFTGHGIYYEGTAYLCPTEVSYYSALSEFISTNELESTLNAIPGTKVVFLDSCHSGGFIGKEINQGDIMGYSKSFNDDVINTFMTRDLTNSQYQVLTSCLSSQTSLELIPFEGDPWGLFSTVLCVGCGYDYYSHPYDADANANGEITLNEAYLYTDEQVDIIIDILNGDPYYWNVDQDTQVYPENSDFVIIEE